MHFSGDMATLKGLSWGWLFRSFLHLWCRRAVGSCLLQHTCWGREWEAAGSAEAVHSCPMHSGVQETSSALLTWGA